MDEVGIAWTDPARHEFEPTGCERSGQIGASVHTNSGAQMPGAVAEAAKSTTSTALR
ncbi:MAG TPA: hypothetical protein VII69_06220 [Candidatus Eremiobacteraceae bacterium]